MPAQSTKNDRSSPLVVALLIAAAVVVGWLCWLTWTRTAAGKAVPIFQNTEENRKLDRVGKVIGGKDGR